MSRAKLTNEDKIDNLLCSVSLEEAESMLARAEIVLRIRQKEAATQKKGNYIHDSLKTKST